MSDDCQSTKDLGQYHIPHSCHSASICCKFLHGYEELHHSVTATSVLLRDHNTHEARIRYGFEKLLRKLPILLLLPPVLRGKVFRYVSGSIRDHSLIFVEFEIHCYPLFLTATRKMQLSTTSPVCFVTVASIFTTPYCPLSCFSTTFAFAFIVSPIKTGFVNRNLSIP